MARRVRDRNLETREARRRLTAQAKPYYKQIEPGVHLGYRKRRNGSGTWEARHYIGDERYFREKIGVADDLSDANIDGVGVLSFWQAQEKAREHMISRARSATGKIRKLTVDAIMRDYLSFVEHERKDFLNARQRVEAFILPHFGGKDAASLMSKDIIAWHRKLAELPARVRTPREGAEQRYKPLDTDDAKRRRKVSANRILTVFKAALNRAFENGELQDDREWRRVKPFTKVERARIEFLEISEARRLLNASDPAFRRLVQAALSTGCRYGELLCLKVGDFSPAKGKAPASLAINDSKSGHPRRVLLNDEGIKFFSELILGRAKDEIMMRRADGTQWKASQQARPMKDACRKARIAPAVPFHALRHTYASLSLMNGTPMLVVSRNLGHTNTMMVEKHYGHLTKIFEAEAINKGTPRFGYHSTGTVISMKKRR